MASPLLLAAKPMDLEDRGFVCNIDRPSAAEGSGQYSEQYSQEAEERAIAQPISTQYQALVNSEQELSAFSRARWATALRLLLSNPYVNETATSPGGVRTSPATAPTQNDCLASATGEIFLSQEPDLLPVLGPPPSQPINQPVNRPVVTPPVVPPPVVTPSTPPVRPAPAAVTPTAPTTPTMPTTVTPLPAPVSPTPATIDAPSGLSTGPASFDPSNITPTTVDPTPFDGLTISTLASKPDGNYRYLAGAAEQRAYTDEELQQQGGSIFVLKKEGNRITGSLLPRLGSPGICVTGVASGNTVSGFAYPDGDAQPQSNLPGALQVRQVRTENEGFYYAGAVLDLSGFTPINAGASLPPERCAVSPSTVATETEE